MTNGQFAACWNTVSAKKRLKSRVGREIITKASTEVVHEPVVPVTYPCANRKCVQGEDRKRARVDEKTSYCSGKCSHFAKMVKKQSAKRQNGGNRVETVKSASETPINIGA
jgi:hypothetical protein